MKKIGYLRVSTDEQKVDRQIDGLRSLCDELHLEKLSAVSRKRPVYDRVKACLERGDMLVVWDLDRAYRSARDALNELNALTAHGVNFTIANMRVDTTTPEGYWIYTMLSANGELERKTLSRRTKEGLAAARRRGKRLGRPRKLSDCQIADARTRLQAKESTIMGLAKEYKVGRWTLSRALKRAGQQ